MGGLLASLCVQEELPLAGRETHRVCFRPRNFGLPERSQWSRECFVFSPEKYLLERKTIEASQIRKHEKRKVGRT